MKYYAPFPTLYCDIYGRLRIQYVTATDKNAYSMFWV